MIMSMQYLMQDVPLSTTYLAKNLPLSTLLFYLLGVIAVGQFAEIRDPSVATLSRYLKHSR